MPNHANGTTQITYISDRNNNSWAYLGNTGHKMGINPWWDARTSEGTMYTHVQIQGQVSIQYVVSLDSMFLGSGRKLESPEEIHRDMERICRTMQMKDFSSFCIGAGVNTGLMIIRQVCCATHKHAMGRLSRIP